MKTGIDLVTTMFDYYKLPKDFPGKGNLLTGTCYERVDILEKAFTEDINHRNFFPYHYAS